jgi:hypothetical protein
MLNPCIAIEKDAAQGGIQRFLMLGSCLAGFE